MLTAYAARPATSAVAYAQCWEDADVLLEALDIRSGHSCLSIASAGDNTLALLAHAPARVVAIDCNPAQIACLELRVAAYRELAHSQMLELIGSAPSLRRSVLYRRCRGLLSSQARSFWDERPEDIESGVGAAGRFERYLALFRDRVLPAIHPRSRVDRLLRGGGRDERKEFYDREWDTLAWRTAFRIFFSRAVMGSLGRDRACFRHAQRSIASHLLTRVRHACTALNPAHNPYLHWILTGGHGATRPFALRAENFAAIGANLHRLSWHCVRIEAFLARQRSAEFDRCNLSDAFEYMAAGQYDATLRELLRTSRPGARFAYWNLLVPRHRPELLASELVPCTSTAARLHDEDKAFFYGDFVLEEVA